MSKMCVRWKLWSAAILFLALSRSASSQAISNGGFEANGGTQTSLFNDWTGADLPGSADSFYVQSGIGTPVFGNLTPPPPEGQYAAMTDSGGAGSHVLYQDFVVPVGGSSAILSFQAYINNQAADFVAPATLDYSAGDNQQARVDLLLASSDPFSVAGSDVLLNLYQTQPSDPLTSGYTLVNTDITSVLMAHAGETLRLRFAEVENLQTLNFGVDDVRLTVVPEPSAIALLPASVLIGAACLSRRRRAR